MIKLSAVLPATDGASSPGARSTGSRSMRERRSTGQQDAGSTYTAAIDSRDWASQASSIMQNLPEASKYKSIALHAEVKLAEALDKCAQACPDTFDEDGSQRPNKLRTAVCCQLLEEVSEMCGPFASVLRSLREELLRSIYSAYYAPGERAAPLAFDQLPWFGVAARLRCENEALLQEQRRFRVELAAHEQEMARVESVISALKGAMDVSESQASALRATVTALQRSEAVLASDADASAKEAKRLAVELGKVREELLDTRDALSASKDASAQLTEEWGAQLEALKKELHAAQEEKNAACHLAATRLSPEDVQDLKNRAEEAEEQLDVARRHVAELEARVAELNRGDLTPRPDWGRLKPVGEDAVTEPTADAVRHILGRATRERTSLQQQLDTARALLAPDPQPAHCELTIATESSSYFLTEAPVPSNGPPKTTATALGQGSEVPRFLRSEEGTVVELRLLTREEVEREATALWKARAEQRGKGVSGTGHLQTFLHEHALAKAGGVAGAAAAAAACYSLYYGCCQHREASPAARLLLGVLTGKLAEGVFWDQQAMLAGLVAVLQEAASAAPGAPPSRPGSAAPSHTAQPPRSLSADELLTALRLFFPESPPSSMTELSDALAAMCAGSGGSVPLTALQAALRRQMAARGADAGSSRPESPARKGMSADDFVRLLMRQHLEGIEAHTAAVLTSARMVLESANRTADSTITADATVPSSPVAAANTRPPSASVVISNATLNSSSSNIGSMRAVPWAELAAAVAGSRPSSSSSSAGMTNRSGFSSRYVSHSGFSRVGGISAAGMDQPLLAAAASARRVSAEQDSALAGAASQHGDLHLWLECARLAGVTDTEQLLRGIQRECLLKAGMTFDAAGALQWCKRVLRAKHQGSTSGLLLPDIA